VHRFEILSELRDVSVIASGRGVRDRDRLSRMYGVGHWRKLKGHARIKLVVSEEIVEAELHWYEAHGIGKREFKVKSW